MKINSKGKNLIYMIERVKLNKDNDNKERVKLRIVINRDLTPNTIIFIYRSYTLPYFFIFTDTLLTLTFSVFASSVFQRTPKV